MTVWGLFERALTDAPTRLAVVDEEARHTYEECGARVRRLAAWLVRAGVTPGSRVAIIDRNSLAFFESTFAVAAVGGVLCPLNVRLGPRETAEILVDMEPRLVLARRDGAEELRSALEGRRVLWIGTDYEAVVEGGPVAFSPTLPEPHDPAQLYYTSGTTGRPKGVILTHRNLCAHAWAAIDELQLTRADVFGHVAPMFHLADAWATLAVTAVGGVHAIARSADPEIVLDVLRRERVTLTNLVPTVLQRLLAELGDERFEGGALRLLLSGGAAIAPATVRRTRETFGCEYAQTYGMTETSPFLTISLLREHHAALTDEERLALICKTGRPFQGVELEVVDENGNPVERDERAAGEIRVRGESVSPGYWNRPEETAAVFRGGWLYTGDLAVQDAEGYVTIVDRKKDLIVTGGENVYSIEVENVLYQHPAVLEAAVYGLPDDEWGECVVAAVVLKAACEASADELARFCRELLAHFKCPRRLRILDELPKTGSGKVRNEELRRMG